MQRRLYNLFIHLLIYKIRGETRHQSIPKGDTRHEKQTWLATHGKETNFKVTVAEERNLEGDTRQKLVKTATHAIKAKLKATRAMKTNL